MPCGLRGDSIPVFARIVGLAQTVEVFEQAFGVKTAYEVAHARRGRWFDPALVDALDTFADDATFWGELRDADAISALRTCEPPTRVVYANELRLDTIAEAFARVIDAKSPFTARHSQNVSFLATRTAMELDMTSREVRALRRAALLHDIGKLGVSSNILDKPSSLTTEEMTEMKRHTRFTLEILKGVPRFERFAMLAASHHERLDGSGYHIGLAGDELGLSARVLAAADVCEALSGATALPCGTIPRCHDGPAPGTGVRRGALSGCGRGADGMVHRTADRAHARHARGRLDVLVRNLRRRRELVARGASWWKGASSWRELVAKATARLMSLKRRSITSGDSPRAYAELTCGSPALLGQPGIASPGW